MNLTLGTLATLKVWLLPESERSGTDWDSAIANIGKGAAAALERHCNRKFARTVADTFECSADRTHVVLPRYPVEAVTKVEIRRSIADGWVELTDVIANQNLAAGLILFDSELGSWSDRLRITYTGGYWLDESDDVTTTNSRQWQQASVGLSVNAEELAITFPDPFTYVPAVNTVIVPPAGGMLIQAVPQSITASGFTARFGFPIPATGYLLQWTALLATVTESPGSGEQPAGSTAVPAALQVAWLQQCAHLWRQKDKLGSGLAANSGEAVASKFDLAEGIAESAFHFRRLSML